MKSRLSHASMLEVSMTLAQVVDADKEA